MPNPIWSGVVAFGMVSIPVRLYPATESKDFRFHLLHREDASRIKQRYYCPADGELVETYDLVRGFEVTPGRYIAMTEEDFRQSRVNQSAHRRAGRVREPRRHRPDSLPKDILPGAR